MAVGDTWDKRRKKYSWCPKRSPVVTNDSVSQTTNRGAVALSGAVRQNYTGRNSCGCKIRTILLPGIREVIVTCAALNELRKSGNNRNNQGSIGSFRQVAKL